MRLHVSILLVLHLLISVMGAAEGLNGLLKVLNNDGSEAKRLEAFESLEKNTAIDARQVMRSICDTSPLVRAAALRVGSAFASSDPELELRLIALVNDRSPLVQAQMLKSLPYFRSARAAAALKTLIAVCQQSPDPLVKSLAQSAQKTP